MSKAFKSIFDASLTDTVFTAEVEVTINRLEDIFDENGIAAVVAALICAIHRAKKNGRSEEDFIEYVRGLYAIDFSRKVSSS